MFNPPGCGLGFPPCVYLCGWRGKLRFPLPLPVRVPAGAAHGQFIPGIWGPSPSPLACSLALLPPPHWDQVAPGSCPSAIPRLPAPPFSTQGKETNKSRPVSGGQSFASSLTEQPEKRQVTGGEALATVVSGCPGLISGGPAGAGGEGYGDSVSPQAPGRWKQDTKPLSKKSQHGGFAAGMSSVSILAGGWKGFLERESCESCSPFLSLPNPHSSPLKARLPRAAVQWRGGERKAKRKQPETPARNAPESFYAQEQCCQLGMGSCLLPV